jgi:SAM-dependent methyltransferase
MIFMKYKVNKKINNLLLKDEAQDLREFLERIFGYYLLQLGGSVHYDLLEASPIEHKIYFSTEDNATIVGKFDELPFLQNSIDLVVIPHTLEFAKKPKKILSEVYHVLITGGSVLVIGFNPFSLWGLMHLFKNKFITITRMRRWLLKIGFQVIKHKIFFSMPPIQNNYLRKILRLFCGAVYILEAKKTAVALTPIKVKGRLVKEHVTAPGAYIKPIDRVRNEKN